MRVYLTGILAVGLLALAPPLRACSVPVFRYALERWEPDAFRVTVVHRGQLLPGQRELASRLASKVADVPGANAKVDLVNLDGSQPAIADQFTSYDSSDGEPWIVVRAPAKSQSTTDVFSAPMTRESVEAVLDSPVRNDVAERLINGHSVVWVLLEGGDKKADEDAARTLSAQLARLEEELKLPEIDPNDVQEEDLTVDADALKLRLSMLRLSRDDDRERALVQMLLATEPDLRDEQFVGLPMAFPVFGRGRVLYALIGKGISADTISAACEFLTGPCQCTVKAENPGADLLTTVDWEARIVPSLETDSSSPELVGLGQFAAVEGPPPTANRPDAPPESAPSSANPATDVTVDSTQAGSNPSTPSAQQDVTQGDFRPADRGSVGSVVFWVLAGLVLLVAALTVILMNKPA